ncbi:type II toxin-antitoxin system VapC family toxin, partial [Synechocystis salina LEGE 06155]|nr:type II toxin-antitoxin system VapC family toxin [Synechocystis salina LEGE 06155]
VKKERITLSKTVSEWFESALESAGIELLPINEIVANCAVELSPIHRDPFDRLIIATALTYNAQLASVDGKFAVYPELSKILLPKNREPFS